MSPCLQTCMFYIDIYTYNPKCTYLSLLIQHENVYLLTKARFFNKGEITASFDLLDQ